MARVNLMLRRAAALLGQRRRAIGDRLRRRRADRRDERGGGVADGGWRWRTALFAALATGGTCAAVFTTLSLITIDDDRPPAYAVEMALPPAAEAPPASVGVDGGLTVPPFSPQRLAGLPPPSASEPLPKAPDADLVESSEAGLLPKIGGDGRAPRQAYARPFDRRDDRARLVLIVGGIGLSRAAGEAAINHLPAAVVLAVDAYAPHPEDWARAARHAGHEVLATLPLQQAAFPFDDAGPSAVPADAAPAEMVQRLDRVLGRFTGYVGVLTQGGGGFRTEWGRLAPVVAALHRRGLLLVDGSVGVVPADTPGEASPLLRLAGRSAPPGRAVDLVVDATPTAAAIDRQLAELTAVARQRFVAVGLASPLPLTIERLRTFLAGLDETRYVLAPISAVAATEGTP